VGLGEGLLICGGKGKSEVTPALNVLTTIKFYCDLLRCKNKNKNNIIQKNKIWKQIKEF
jgi:hypothetical protein